MCMILMFCFCNMGNFSQVKQRSKYKKPENHFKEGVKLYFFLKKTVVSSNTLFSCCKISKDKLDRTKIRFSGKQDGWGIVAVLQCAGNEEVITELCQNTHTHTFGSCASSTRQQHLIWMSGSTDI